MCNGVQGGCEVNQKLPLGCDSGNSTHVQLYLPSDKKVISHPVPTTPIGNKSIQ